MEWQLDEMLCHLALADVIWPSSHADFMSLMRKVADPQVPFRGAMDIESLIYPIELDQ